MIGSRSVAILVAATVSCVVAAWVATSFRGSPSSPASGARTPLLPELAARGEAIDRVEIERGSSKIVLARGSGGEGWVASDHADYPIDDERLRAVLAAMARLERTEALTALPARHSELGLAWPDDAGQATLVRLFEAGAPIAEIILGRTRFSPPTVYARRLHEDQTWRCLGEVTIDANPIRMMSPVVIELPGDAVTRIESDAGDGGGDGIVLERRHREGSGRENPGPQDPGPPQWVIETRAVPEVEGELDQPNPGEPNPGEPNPGEPSPGEPSPGEPSPGEPRVGKPEPHDAGVEDGRHAEIVRILPELFTRLEFDAVRRTPEAPVAPDHRITAQVGDRTVTVEILPEESAGEPGSTLAAPGRWFRVVVGVPEPWLGALAPPESVARELAESATRSAGREFRLPAWRSARLLAVLKDRR